MLIGAFRENTLKLAQGFLAFEQKDFKKALSVVDEVAFYTDASLGLRGRMLEAKSCYEMKAEESFRLEQALDRFDKHIFEYKIVGTERSMYKNFIKFTRQLNAPNTFSKKQLLEDINACECLAGKKWLLEKVIEK